MDTTALGSSNVDPVQLIHSGGLPFRQFRKLGSSFDQILADLGPQVLIDLYDLQLDFRNFSFGLSDCSRQLAALALETSRVALQCRHPRNRDKVLLKQRANSIEFLVDQIDFLLLGLALSRVTLDLFQ